MLRRAFAAPPQRFENAAELALQLHEKWTEVIPRCQEAAAAKDMQRYEQLTSGMYELRDLTEQLGNEIQRQLR